MKRLHSAVLCLSLAIPAGDVAAQSPSTDIFVADLRVAGTAIEIGAPVNVTSRPGYDNQPWFTRDGAALLYNAEIDAQTDIFRYDLTTGGRTQLTHTADNEYSPSLTPAGELLVVRWPVDMSMGALWRYSAAAEPIAPHPASVERIGYYGVIDGDRIAVFVNDSARTFVVADGSTGERRVILTDMAGSPPQRIPGEEAVSFMMPADDDSVWIHRLDLATGDITKIAPAVGESRSYAWLPGGVLLMPSASAVYAFDTGSDVGWREAARFADPALANIVRIAVSAAADRVALVAEQAPAR